MSRKNANTNQIIRKDGKNCFVEVLKNSFEIGKVLLKFVTYDENKAVGEKFTNEVDIYLSFEQFLRLAYDILDSRQLINRILKDQQAAKAAGKKWPEQRILAQGGTSAKSLAIKGKSRDDGKSISRVLKLFAGDTLPLVFVAELGPGEENNKGLIVPRFGPKYGNTAEQKVMFGLSADDAKELFLLTREEIRAYLNAKRLMEMMNPEQNTYSKNTDTSNSQNTGYKQQTTPAQNTNTQNTAYKQQTAPAPAPNSNFMNPPQVPEEPNFPIDEDLFSGGPDGFFN